MTRLVGGKRLVLAAVLAGLAGAGLAGCGLKGDLTTPPPLWGDKSRATVDRGFPSGGRQEEDRVVFTRDDVDIFRRDEEQEDPFAEDDEAQDGAAADATGSAPSE